MQKIQQQLCATVETNIRIIHPGYQVYLRGENYSSRCTIMIK